MPCHFPSIPTLGFTVLNFTWVAPIGSSTGLLSFANEEKATKAVRSIESGSLFNCQTEQVKRQESSEGGQETARTPPSRKMCNFLEDGKEPRKTQASIEHSPIIKTSWNRGIAKIAFNSWSNFGLLSFCSISMLCNFSALLLCCVALQSPAWMIKDGKEPRIFRMRPLF